MEFDETAFIKPGELTFEITLAPVSLQAKKLKKDFITQAIRSNTKRIKKILVGDVQIFVEWLIQEKRRYESDSSPDIDNILKPIIDALCGPDGILIDDCQVQAIDCRWIDWKLENEKLDIRVRFISDEYLPKKGLVFVEIEKKLYFPINSNLSAKYLNMILKSWQRALALKNEFLTKTNNYYIERGIMPILRPFHITRLKEFRIISFKEFMAQIENGLRNSNEN